MGIALSIENVPEEKVELLKQRAERNHRSLQSELMAIINAATEALPHRPMTIEELAELGRRRGLSMPDESAQMIREDRGR
jgi:plasmid stability protein